jgi:thiamine biosynthesis lipoprotein
VAHRPPGVRLDTGGTGKGLAADLASSRLSGYARYAVDAGGDLRIGGDRPVRRRVDIDHPLSKEPAFSFGLVEGAVATSGLATRLWRTDRGFAHHLLDPSTGAPAWTGVVQATAIAETALEAEVLAKVALLSGPEKGRAVLMRRGGVLILDDGQVEVVGGLATQLAAETPMPAAA